MRPVAPLLAGIALAAGVLVLGFLATAVDLRGWGLGVDQSIADHFRSPAGTAIAAALTTSATPSVVGIAAVVVVPLGLLLVRRRTDALQAMCVIGGALAFALVVKAVVAEPRPPAALWAIPADSGTSYPSGHTAVAASIAVALTSVARHRTWRRAAVIVGGVWAIAVAASRVYLADHYPLDVIGSLLTALAAGLTASGIARLVAHAHLSHAARHRKRQRDGPPSESDS